MNLFNLNSTLVTIWGYDLSYLECLTTIFGILNVYCLSKLKVSNYFWGILNVILSFFIFFQSQMYSDMVLQIYYLIINIYGWWLWLHPGKSDADSNNQLKVSTNSILYNTITFAISCVAFVLLGIFLKNIHVILPSLFKIPSSYPFVDSFITTVSVVAMYFMAKKKIEHWYLWFVTDLTSMIIFYIQGIKFVSFEYFVFLFFAFIGYIEWRKEMNHNAI